MDARAVGGQDGFVSSSSVLFCASFTDRDRAHLRLSFQATSLRQAGGIAAELGTVAADVPLVHQPAPGLPGQRNWIVSLTSPPLPLTLEVIQFWEGGMLTIEQRWPGCRFLGWRTYGASAPPPAGSGEPAHARAVASACERRSQRELVAASLLRQPGDRRGIAHRR
jgi:hypothetical protein